MSQLHYRIKTRYTFGNVPEYCFLHASNAANKIYDICNTFRDSLNLEKWKLKVLHVRNVDQDVYIRLEIMEKFESLSTLIEKILEYKYGKVAGIWIRTLHPLSDELVHGDEHILDYLELPDKRKFYIPTSIDSFTTLNRYTMPETYNYMCRHSTKNIIIIGRDVIRAGYWLNNAPFLERSCICLSECKQILIDAEQTIKLPENSDFKNPEFRLFESSMTLSNTYTYTYTYTYTVIYNGRDYAKAADWVSKNKRLISKLIILTCKRSKIPTLSEYWTKIDSIIIDQQPGVAEIIQQIDVFIPSSASEF